ncbi:putative lipoprotein [Melaminivora alkalimesophila]|uniref:Putative lipoprotein n=2 Tax=Melaminivora alkalimesophila TaxID=1165852 RepID=A0A317RB59_9BURK|nr:YbaY family lipoprotein [Melaminivora alkalimesophila]PWW46744.1 putative lipoprotein [Melaminivora alkalimesophila]
MGGRAAASALVLAALAALLAGCAAPGPAPDAVVTGTVLARERLVVPPGAVFEAALVDATQPAAPPVVLARQRVADPGPPPYPLRLPYHQARVAPGGRYEVRAGVWLQGRLWLETPDTHPVLVQPDFRHVDVFLARVPELAATAAAAVPLRRTWWRLVELVDGPPVAPPAAGAPPAHLLLGRDPGRAAGSGGCNRFALQFVQDGARLRFQGLQSGLRLCLDGGTSELAYLERLLATAAFFQEGRQLELRGADGRALLRFVAEEWGEPPIADDDPPMLPQ